MAHNPEYRSANWIVEAQRRAYGMRGWRKCRRELAGPLKYKTRY